MGSGSYTQFIVSSLQSAGLLIFVSIDLWLGGYGKFAPTAARRLSPMLALPRK